MRTRHYHIPFVVVVLAAFYYIAAELGLSVAVAYASKSPVWPPTGIALAAVLLLGYRIWPGIALGAFLGTCISGEAPATALAIALGNTLGALLGAYLLRRFCGEDDPFDRARDVFLFALLAGALSTAVSATVGLTGLCLAGVTLWKDYGSLWLTWWLGDAVGDLLVAPMLFVWFRRSGPQWSPGWYYESLGLFVLLVAASLIAFGGWLPSGVSYLGLPFIVWAAFRFGPRGATFAVFISSVIAIWGTAKGRGPFAYGSVEDSLLLLQAFLATITVTGLGLAAVVSERKRAEEALEHSHGQMRSLAAHLQGVREEERARIAREVHDDLGHALSLLKMNTHWLNVHIPAQEESVRGKLGTMSTVIDGAIRTVRRIATELRPSELDHLGLVAAIESHVADFQERTGIECKFTATPAEVDVDAGRATTLFRILQEALTNVLRHADATRVNVMLAGANDRVELKVRDNGRGITQTQAMGPISFGLLGMRERAQEWSGTMNIRGLPGEGTEVSIRIPLGQTGNREGIHD